MEDYSYVYDDKGEIIDIVFFQNSLPMPCVAYGF